MAKECTICKKTSSVGGTTKLLRGHYNPTSRRRIYPNLQIVRMDNGKKVAACAKCIKRLHKK